MRSLSISLLTAVASVGLQNVALAKSAFAPKVSDICSPSGGGNLTVNPRKFVARLVEKHAGLSPIDLDTEGNGVSYRQEADALLHPEVYCSQNACAKDTVKKLGEANVILIDFVSSHGAPLKAGVNAYNTSSIPISEAGLEDFLSGNGGTVTCFVPPVDKAPPAPGPDGTPGTAPEIPQHFALRKNVEDLHYSQDDQKFKGLDQASLSWSDDRVAERSSFAIDAAFGYTLGRASFDEEGRFIGQITPFMTYQQKYVETSDESKDSRLQNIGFGVIGDLTFPIGGIYQNIQFYPKYTSSIASDARVLSGNFVYTPMYGIPGIDNAYYMIPDMLSFQFHPSVRVSFSDVLDEGTNATLAEQGSYFWVGPRLGLSVYGEGILDGFTYNISYETYAVPDGKIKSVSNFQTSLSYDFGEKKLVSLRAGYENGRNLDTLEKVQEFTVGLGMKY